MVIDLAQALRVDVAVHLRGRERGVAQELLDRPQVGAALEQVRRERVPQAMRMRDEPAQRRGVQAAAVRREEQRVVRAARELRVARRGDTARRGTPPPRRAGSRGPSRPCPGGRARAPARSRRRRGRARPPRRCAARPSRRARRARGSASGSGPSPSSAVEHLADLALLRRVRAGAASAAAGTACPGRVPAPSVKRSSARTAASLREIVAGASRPPGRPRPRSATQSASTRTSTRSISPSPYQRANSRRSEAYARCVPAEIARSREKARAGGFDPHSTRSSRRGYHRLPVADRWQRLGELAVAGANVQRGQVLLVSAEHGQAEAARAVAAAAYKRGAKFVDVVYFDPYLKRARIEHADDDTLSFVPEWLGAARLAHAAGRGARISFGGVTVPNLLSDLDPERLGKDQLPRLKESIADHRRPHHQLVHRPGAAPGVGEARLPGPRARTTRTSGSGRTSSTSCASTSRIPQAAWVERMAVLNDERAQAHRAALRRDPPGRARHRSDRRPLPRRAPGGPPTSARSTG